MCFYHEPGWNAEVSEDGTVTLDRSVRCEECHNRIHAGQQCRHVWMQQYEECRRCMPDLRGEWDDEYEGGELEPCPDGKHDYGETFECHVCDLCEMLRAAIQHVEADAGCVENEAEPAFGELREAMWESDHAEEYIERAREAFPELAVSGHLDEFYRLTRAWDKEFEDQEQWDADDLEPVGHDELGGEG